MTTERTHVINTAARRMTDAAPSPELRARVMTRIAVPSLWTPWRLALAGGAVGTAAIVTAVLWPAAPLAPALIVPVPTTVAADGAPTVAPSVEPLTVYAAPPTIVEVVRVAAPDDAATVTAPITSAAWEARRTAALMAPEPLRVDALQPSPLSIDTIDITPLSVAPLVVPAMGGGH